MTNQVFYGLFRAETPLNHQSIEKMDTTTICRYNRAILPDGRQIKVYNISASAYRNAIRRHAAKRLFDLLDINPTDLPEISNVIFLSGGPRLESGETVPLGFMRMIRSIFPSLDLLGTTTPFCMIPSAMFPTRLNAMTRENTIFYVEQMVRDAFEINASELPDTVTEFEFGCKRDTRESEAESHKLGTVANMFDTQLIMQGTQFGHQVVIKSDNPLTIGCFASALAEWARCGGYIGGKIAQGSGIVSWRYSPAAGFADEYEKYITKDRQRLTDLIMDSEIWTDKQKLLKLCK